MRVDATAIPIKSHEVIVVGTGLAGLAAAIALAPRSVTLITKTAQLQSGSSCRAKGGIAVAISVDDTSLCHAADTIASGAGISDPQVVLQMTSEAAEALQWLLDKGVPLDRGSDGKLALAREAAHSLPRIVHAGGDATGYVLINSLIEQVRQMPSITVFSNTLVYDLIIADGAVQGLISWSPTEGWTGHQCDSIVLATGGIGTAWWYTTNPAESTGDGLAMAARAGAELADLEFMQFHPTALATGKENAGSSLPLLTEALRGAGAFLIDESNCRFMVDEHADAELAPRDVVAQAIVRRANAGERVFLDLRPIFANGGEYAFPEAMAAARNAGLDPRMEPLPIAVAAHFHMGGIRTDECGRSSLKGLWACGEVSTTGIHGANRLASNSLLEALVYARRIAKELSRYQSQASHRPSLHARIPAVPLDNTQEELRSVIEMVRRLLSRQVGVLRSGTGLKAARLRLATLDVSLGQLVAMGESTEARASETILLWSEARNLLLVAQLVSMAAIQRAESRGAHFRLDYPAPRPEWQRHQPVFIYQLNEGPSPG